MIEKKTKRKWTRPDVFSVEDRAVERSMNARENNKTFTRKKSFGRKERCYMGSVPAGWVPVGDVTVPFGNVPNVLFRLYMRPLEEQTHSDTYRNFKLVLVGKATTIKANYWLTWLVKEGRICRSDSYRDGDTLSNKNPALFSWSESTIKEALG